MVLGGHAPFLAPERVPGESRKLRYDSGRGQMGDVLFPGDAPRASPNVPLGHRNVTSSNHPFLATEPMHVDASVLARRSMHRRADTSDMLAGPVGDSAAQLQVGRSAYRAKEMQHGHAGDSPEAKPIAGAGTRRGSKESMGAVLFGGGAPAETLMSGRRHGAPDYSQYQLRAQRADGAPSPAPSAAASDRSRYGLPPAPLPMGKLGGGGGALPPRAPPALAPPAAADSLDGLMRDGEFVELRHKYHALAAELQAAPRDDEGMIADIATVADALRKQVCERARFRRPFARARAPRARARPALTRARARHRRLRACCLVPLRAS
jgi:hypothetical protein